MPQIHEGQRIERAQTVHGQVGRRLRTVHAEWHHCGLQLAPKPDVQELVEHRV